MLNRGFIFVLIELVVSSNINYLKMFFVLLLSGPSYSYSFVTSRT